MPICYDRSFFRIGENILYWRTVKETDVEYSSDVALLNVLDIASAASFDERTGMVKNGRLSKRQKKNIICNVSKLRELKTYFGYWFGRQHWKWTRKPQIELKFKKFDQFLRRSKRKRTVKGVLEFAEFLQKKFSVYVEKFLEWSKGRAKKLFFGCWTFKLK